eukprot:scaffold11890_cov33-Tisochrysis_lutea.AAC.1
MRAFTKALSEGALKSLEKLDLHHNRIQEEGIIALLDTLSRGRLSNLNRLIIHNNDIDEGLQKAFTAHCRRRRLYVL